MILKLELGLHFYVFLKVTSNLKNVKSYVFLIFHKKVTNVFSTMASSYRVARVPDTPVSASIRCGGVWLLLLLQLQTYSPVSTDGVVRMMCVVETAAENTMSCFDDSAVPVGLCNKI